jgi:cytochrome c553
MRRALLLVSVLAATPAFASPPMDEMPDDMPPPPPIFAFLTAPLVLKPPENVVAPTVTLASTPIVADRLDALVIDADSGDLVRVDRSTGKPTARLAIAPGASSLALDAKLRVAYVADRASDRIHVVQVADKELIELRRFATHEEPFGVALTPDARTLLVTHAAGRVLAAYDPATGKELWSVPLAAEPRGVAISPDGTRAIIAYLAADHVDQIVLATKAITSRPIDAALQPAATHVRGAMTAAFVGNGVAIVPHQISMTDQPQAGQVRPGTYGGGLSPPIESRLGFIADASLATATVSVLIEPRALAWDAHEDRLFVASYGNDQLLAIDHASDQGAQLAFSAGVPSVNGCGLSGLAVADDGGAMAWCELARRVAFVMERPKGTPDVVVSDEVSKSQLAPDVQRGRALFRASDPRLAMGGAFACASCHPEGRTDGLTWRIEKNALQTPILAGRIDGTGPYKWDGRDKTLADSLKDTIGRLGGTGLPDEQIADLQAYLDSLPRPRVANALDASAAARGKAIFESNAVGCSSCHSGAKLSDGKLHDLATDLDHVDTPSLVAVALSAPYFHDGSATTLRDVVTGKGTIVGMGKISGLKPGQVDDLVAYLQTL